VCVCFVCECVPSHPVCVCSSAATLALSMGNQDLHKAAFVLHKALTSPPICRHLLTSGCYRSDCAYSHDPGQKTCLFWVRGKCRETECRFMHGFADDGIDGFEQWDGLEWLREQGY